MGQKRTVFVVRIDESLSPYTGSEPVPWRIAEFFDCFTRDTDLSPLAKDNRAFHIAQTIIGWGNSVLTIHLFHKRELYI